MLNTRIMIHITSYKSPNNCFIELIIWEAFSSHSEAGIQSRNIENLARVQTLILRANLCAFQYTRHQKCLHSYAYRYVHKRMGIRETLVWFKIHIQIQNNKQRKSILELQAIFTEANYFFPWESSWVRLTENSKILAFHEMRFVKGSGKATNMVVCSQTTSFPRHQRRDKYSSKWNWIRTWIVLSRIIQNS